MRWRQTRAGPILARFADWLDLQNRPVTPKSLLGEAGGCARNHWPSPARCSNDARFAIDNGGADRANRPIAIGRANWLQIGGDGSLATASVLLSVCASARRNRLDPWANLSSVLAEVSVRAPGADAADLRPDQWAKARGGPETPPAHGRRYQ